MAPLRFAVLPAAFVAAALVIGSLLGPAALPSWDEPIPDYGARLLAHTHKASADLLFRILLTLPGGAKAVVGDPRAAVESYEEKPSAANKQDTLRQEVAKDEKEIDAQQQVSVQRYKKVLEEEKASGKEEPLILPEQPDEVRARMPQVMPDGPEMRCNEAIPPQSSVTTRDIELRAKSTFWGKTGDQYVWKYTVTFKNWGSETVQMMTRHWVFVNQFGQLETETKGPGARGVTPVLPPGAEWNYESGSSLSTPYGSMHGSFQFEVLRGDTSAGKRSFSGRVGRLLLSSGDEEHKKLPCAKATVSELLPLTSVLVTERVILGGHADVTKTTKSEAIFRYDVQFNNARDTEIEIVGHSWTVVGSDGKRRVVAEGPGVGGTLGSRPRRLAAGDAFRVQGDLTSGTRQANAEGTFKVVIKADDGTFREIEVRTDYMGLSADPSVPHVPNFVAGSSQLF